MDTKQMFLVIFALVSVMTSCNRVDTPESEAVETETSDDKLRRQRRRMIKIPVRFRQSCKEAKKEWGATKNIPAVSARSKEPNFSVAFEAIYPLVVNTTSAALSTALKLLFSGKLPVFEDWSLADAE